MTHLNKSKKNYSKSMKRNIAKVNHLSKQISHSHFKHQKPNQRSFQLEKKSTLNQCQPKTQIINQKLKKEYRQVLNNSNKQSQEKQNGKSKFLGTQGFQPVNNLYQNPKQSKQDSIYSNQVPRKRKFHKREDSYFSVEINSKVSMNGNFCSISSNPYKFKMNNSSMVHKIEEVSQDNNQNLTRCSVTSQIDQISENINTNAKKIKITKPRASKVSTISKAYESNNTNPLTNARLRQVSVNKRKRKTGLVSDQKIVTRKLKSPFQVKLNPAKVSKILNSNTKIKLGTSILCKMTPHRTTQRKENTSQNSHKPALRYLKKPKDTKIKTKNKNSIYKKSNFETIFSQKRPQTTVKSPYVLPKSNITSQQSFNHSRTYSYRPKPQPINLFPVNKQIMKKTSGYLKSKYLLKHAQSRVTNGTTRKGRPQTRSIYQSSFVPSSYLTKGKF